VKLPNGRKIEILTKEGADEFIEAVGTDFISRNLTATNDAELSTTYMIMSTVVGSASPEKIADGFPEPELHTFVEHTRDTLDILSTDRTWLRSGKLPIPQLILLQIVSSFWKHPSFVKIFLSNEVIEALAKFYASRKKNDTPNTPAVADTIIILVRFILAQEGLSDEIVFGTIEKTGLLGQFAFLQLIPNVLPVLWNVCKHACNLSRRSSSRGPQRATF
jgi:hypothetical protein